MLESDTCKSEVTVLGIFVADTTFKAARMPKIGETLFGEQFYLSPGGKGSNQAVAASKAGAKTRIIAMLGNDQFAQMALELWEESGVIASITQHSDRNTGAAFVFVDSASKDNAIIVCPGVAETMTQELITEKAHLISSSKIFLTQLETPIDVSDLGLKIAKNHDVITILNPAPATQIPKDIFSLCDYITPNETEAEFLTQIKVTSIDTAALAANKLREMGAKTAIITLGDLGVYFQGPDSSKHIPSFKFGPVLETTGAGDAFNGALAAGLSKGLPPLDASRFGCAAAGISVTRQGTAKSMPSFQEIMAALN